MSDDVSSERPRRRWQFSLRRLLLWTAVVAVYCGAAEFFWRGVSPGIFRWPWYGLPLFSMGVLVIVAVVARVFTRLWIAWLVTTLIGPIVFIPAWYWSSGLSLADLGLDSFPAMFLFFALLLLPNAFGLGWMTFLAVEATCRLVAWADRRIGKLAGAATNG